MASKWYYQNGYLYDTKKQKFVLSNSTAEISSTFLHLTMASKWLQCCKEAELCCINQLNRTSSLDRSKNRCPKTWDGWQCWGLGADPNELATMSCPSHIYWLSFNPPPCLGYVTKKCSINGTWYEQNGWSNFGNCARDDIYIKRSWYKITTHLISVAFIIPALFIFNYYRQLSRVSRIRVHKHLLSSLLIYSILMALLTFQMLLNNSGTSSTVASVAVESTKQGSSAHQQSKITSSNLTTINFTTIICILISLAVKYFRSTSYLWMFNEAFYLHRLIKQAFPTPSLTPLLIIAYGIPTITTATYIYFRLNQLDFDSISTTSPTTNQSSFDSLNSPAYLNSSPIPSKLISKFLDQTSLDSDADLLNLNSISSPTTQMPLDKRLSKRFNFINQSINLKSISAGPFRMQSESLESINDHYSQAGDARHSNSSDLDEVVIDQLNDLISTSYEDQCWSLSSAWHEWIINLPNLCILVVNCIFLLKMLREIYLKAESGQKQFQPRDNPTVHNSLTCSRRIRACFLSTVWSDKSRRSFSPPSVSPNTPKYLHPTLNAVDDHCSNLTLNFSKENSEQISISQTEHSDQKQSNETNSQRVTVKDKNKNVLIGHVIDDNNNQNEIQAEQNNLNNSGNLDNITRSKVSVKSRKSSSKTNFCKTRSAVKRHLSHFMSEKESGNDVATRPNLEQHSSGHRTSILVSLLRCFVASILLPLYGLHYLVFVYRLDTTVCWLSELYHYCSITLDGLQGMLVSILFCFATNEVQQVLKRSFLDRL